MGAVPDSTEFRRVASLPRRVLDLAQVEDVTPLFAKSGEMVFWPEQSAALIEAARAGGLFALMGVGRGKTLVALALPEALDSMRTVYLVRPELKRQLEREAETVYGRHFHLPLDRITIVSYSELSGARTAHVLEDLQPDLIVADEAHCLRHSDSARTKRFLRYAEEHPGCRYAFLSGTMTSRSILDYAHLIALALRNSSPLPHTYYELRDWAGAIDVGPEYRMRPGVLQQFCGEQETVRDGYRRRLVQTQGVVATEENTLGTSLVVSELRPSVPKTVTQALNTLRKTWAIGDEEFMQATEVASALKQVACGFYYRWDWPGGVVDHEWLEARREWHAEVRKKLQCAAEGIDSPYLLACAAQRFQERGRCFTKREERELRTRFLDEGSTEAGADRAVFAQTRVWDSSTWVAWSRVKDRQPPPTVPVWISEFLVDAAIVWAKRQDLPAIIWCEWTALGERIAKKSGFPFYGSGKDASLSSDRVIVASIQSQGTGRNLQHQFARNLFTSVPPNGTIFEQGVGRTHRPGQRADEVIVDWFGHTLELRHAMARVVEDAEYMQRTTGQRQKILYATRVHHE